MEIALIAAMAKERVIGRDNRMPWHLPADLAHFKQLTLGKPIIMGRRTFDSIGRPLPGRVNIVITRQPDWQPDGVLVAHSPQQALALAQRLDGATPTEVMVIGGSDIYRQFLPQARRLYLTQIDLDVADGDTWFPDYQAAGDWQLVESRACQADERNPYAYSFNTLERAA